MVMFFCQWCVQYSSPCEIKEVTVYCYEWGKNIATTYTSRVARTMVLRFLTNAHAVDEGDEEGEETERQDHDSEIPANALFGSMFFHLLL